MLRTSRVRPVRLAPGIGAGLVAALVVLGGPAAALPVPVTYVAPYLHAQKSVTFSTFSSGCTHLAQKPLRWKATTGVGHWYARTVARSCPGPLGGWGVGSSAADSALLSVGVPITPFNGSATPTSLAVTWSILARVNATVHAGGPCPTVVVNPSNGSGSEFCYLGARASLDGYAYLLDRSNGTVYYASNLWGGIYALDLDYNYTSCASFSCSTLNYSYAASTGSGNLSSVTWWINASLNGSHRYFVVTDLYANVSAATIAFPHSLSAAVLDFTNFGRFATLASITQS